MNKNNGFTLIELMIVVVIIGVLASVAIPQFIRYQLKSRTSEVPRNISAIRTSEETFLAKWVTFAYAKKRPLTGGGNSKVAWGTTMADGFDTIGFAIAGAVYYAYSVADGPPVTATGVISPANDTLSVGVVTNPAGYTSGVDVYIQASANLDLIGDHGSFYSTDEDASINPVPGTSGESTF